MADDAAPPETAAACADLFAAIERFNMLALFARGLYETFHGAPRYVPMLEGVTGGFIRTIGTTLDRHGPLIIEASQCERSYDDLHLLVIACLKELTLSLAPHFPDERLGAVEEQFWGDKLKRWPEEQVRELGLPATEREYLSKVGLPTDIGVKLRLESLPPGSAPRVAEGMVVLASDDPMTIAADVDGRVWAREGASKSFVNGSISAFGRCLITHEWYRRSARDVAPNEALAIVQKAIALADPESLASDDHYWAILLRAGTGCGIGACCSRIRRHQRA